MCPVPPRALKQVSLRNQDYLLAAVTLQNGQQTYYYLLTGTKPW